MPDSLRLSGRKRRPAGWRCSRRCRGEEVVRAEEDAGRPEAVVWSEEDAGRLKATATASDLTSTTAIAMAVANLHHGIEENRQNVS